MFDKVKKYVINLKRRPDRLLEFKKEMTYIGWSHEIFDAIDKNGYIGCALSHIEVAKKFLTSKDEYILVFEDDAFFMPYARSMINIAEVALAKMDFDVFHFGPSVHRPLLMYNEVLVDLSNPPPKTENHRGIFGTGAILYSRKVAEKIIKFDIDGMKAIDQLFDSEIYPSFKSFAPKYPIITQRNGFSNVNQTEDRPHYVITYNWNLYVTKLPNKYFDIDNCIEYKSKNDNVSISNL